MLGWYIWKVYYGTCCGITLLCSIRPQPLRQSVQQCCVRYYWFRSCSRKTKEQINCRCRRGAAATTTAPMNFSAISSASPPHIAGSRNSGATAASETSTLARRGRIRPSNGHSCPIDRPFASVPYSGFWTRHGTQNSEERQRDTAFRVLSSWRAILHVGKTSEPFVYTRASACYLSIAPARGQFQLGLAYGV